MPPSPPIKALRALIIVMERVGGSIAYIVMVRGATFCQVASVMQIGQVELAITCGNQKCMGGAPSFVLTPMRMRVERLARFEGAHGVWEDIR